jgi:thioredoxin reductase (NADPH)
LTHVEKLEDGTFRLHTSPASGERITVARRVVLAIGDMHRPRLLGIPGEDLPTVSHYFQDPHHYFRRRLVIVGGKNSAVEAAIRCVRAGADVTLSYRGEELAEERIKYWLLPEVRAMIRDRRLRFLPATRPVEILPGRIRLQRVGAPGGTTDGPSVEDLPADCVLLLTGYEQDPSLFRLFGIELEGPANDLVTTKRPWRPMCPASMWRAPPPPALNWPVSRPSSKPAMCTWTASSPP